MTQSAQWFEDMAKAMKTREKCLNAITRWTEALNKAEEVIKQLADDKTMESFTPVTDPAITIQSNADGSPVDIPAS